jgi:hypothetical protein
LFVGSAASKDASASYMPKFSGVVEAVVLVTIDRSAPPKDAGALSEVLPKLDFLSTRRVLSALAIPLDPEVDLSA